MFRPLSLTLRGFVCALVVLAGCTPQLEGAACASDEDCPAGVCVAGVCAEVEALDVVLPDGRVRDGSTPGAGDGGPTDLAFTPDLGMVSDAESPPADAERPPADVALPPADAEVPSHRLLVRAGYIRRAAPGGFTWLPLGWMVYRNVERIVREDPPSI
jgi:hypothetical protein